jgi:Cohesin domain
MKELLFAVALLFATNVVGSARAAGALSSVASAASVARGDTVQVAVNVDASTPALGCYSFRLVYDLAELRLVAATEGSLFAGAADPTFFGLSFDSTGTEVISDCVLGFGTSLATPGELAVLSFETLVDGVVQLSYADVALRDVDRALITPVSSDTVSVVVGVTSTPPVLSTGLRLVATPNPAAGLSRLGLWDVQGRRTNIAARLGRSSPELSIYDVAGRRIRSLRFTPETSVVLWDGRDGSGSRVAGGLYFAVLQLGDTTLRAKILRID